MMNLLFNIKEKMEELEENVLRKGKCSVFKCEYEKIIEQGYKANPPPKKTGKRGRILKGKVLCLINA